MEVYKFALVFFASAAAADQAPLLDGHLLVDFKAGEAAGNHLLMGFKPASVKYMGHLATVDLMVRTGNPSEDRWLNVSLSAVIDCDSFKHSTVQMVVSDYQTGASSDPVVMQDAEWTPIGYKDWSAPLFESICGASNVNEVVAWASPNHTGVLQSLSDRMIGVLDVTDAGQINWRVSPDAEPVPNELGAYLVANNPNFSR